MHPSRFLPRFILPVALLACLIVSGTAVSSLALEPEVIKGTVKSLKPGVLILSDASFKGDPQPRQEVKVLWDKDTAFFYGTTKVPKEEIAPGCRVLVKCAQVGSERKALLVRVIKGTAK